MRRKGDYTHLVVMTLWAILASVQVQETLGTECSSNQYLDGTLQRCRNCTNCATQGQLMLASCGEHQDIACSSCDMTTQFFNRDTGKCQNCTECEIDQKKNAECTMDEDTVCSDLCQRHQFYHPDLGRCLFNCGLCGLGCVFLGSPRCQCSPSSCYTETDLLCENNICTDPTVARTEATSSSNSQSDNLPSWGIGLISIGVVAGIIVKG